VVHHANTSQGAKEKKKEEIGSYAGYFDVKIESYTTRSRKIKATSIYLHTYSLDKISESTTAVNQLDARTTRRKKFDYFVDYSVNCGLPRSGARHRVLAQIIGNARGDINSPWSAKNHAQDLQFRRNQQHDDPNSAQGLDNNFASDRDCHSTTTTRLRHR
jgi:hypothetical protein